ncbi:hypothetical protein PVAND_016594 [Polypedilum vanderplanki]|uniref:Uncharacterized protein n=1 Tax=Polypedilum vanderplanki TaxID=319348 RepID=A0A9J6BFV9_POLVA|nr:hypothetical protein PVAND_016594 [Polypedilum vanderplanki]
MISIIFFIFTLLSSSDSFTPTKDIHLSCKKIFEYIYTVECQLPIDLQNSDIVRITSKNITTNLPLKIAASNMPEHFPQGVGQNFPEIEELRIWWSELKFIDRESFTKLKILKILDLIGNSIENIPTDTFYDLENVEEINLYKNHIKTLDADLLIKNTKLKKFSAGQNEIEEIPKGFFRNNLEINWNL